jgi:hypothetical protein
MHYLRDLIYRLRTGESERRIAVDLGISRPTVAKYHALAKGQGYLVADAPLPDDATLQSAMGRPPKPPRQPSSVEAYGATVEQLLEQGCEMTRHPGAPSMRVCAKTMVTPEATRRCAATSINGDRRSPA